MGIYLGPSQISLVYVLKAKSGSAFKVLIVVFEIVTVS
jgi:hypothetical protein